MTVESQAHRRILYDDPAFDLRRKTALIGQAPKLEACEGLGEAAAVNERKPTLVEIDATLNCSGMLILADTYFPGWSATLDGRPARIWEADGALLVVVAPCGAHRIVMQYRPRSVWLGLGMTLLGIAGVIALAARRG